ncbi:MAG: DMT family transporter [Treponema sp.]|jgi:drug/metabolite transporter (DMT)-like permease|nr:DMT family transporter [Treponema sp.]
MMPETARQFARDQRIGQGAIFLCAILWSTNGLCIKLLEWHPFVIAGMRSFVSALFMTAMRFAFPRRRKEPFKLRFLWGGGVSYALMMIFFCSANKLTTSANAILLQYGAPIWAALLGWALAGEKPKLTSWISMVMVMGGLVLFSRDALQSGSFFGNGLAIVSGIFFGANSVFLRIQKEGDPADSMLLAHILAAAVSIPFIFVYPPQFNPGNILALLFMGIIQIGLASLLFAYGIRRIPAVQAMLTSVIEPVLNPVWVFLVTGERPTLAALLGGSIIIAAVMVSALGNTQGENRRPGLTPGT